LPGLQGLPWRKTIRAPWEPCHVAAELQLATMGTAVYIQAADFMAVWKRQGIEGHQLPSGRDQLVWWRGLKTARGQDVLAAVA
jgi:hypothetical protein